MKMPQLMPQAEAFLQSLQAGVDGRLHPYHARVIGAPRLSSPRSWPNLFVHLRAMLGGRYAASVAGLPLVQRACKQPRPCCREGPPAWRLCKELPRNLPTMCCLPFEPANLPPARAHPHTPTSQTPWRR